MQVQKTIEIERGGKNLGRVELFLGMKGQPVARGFWGKGAKSFFNYAFKDVDSRQDYIIKFESKVIAHEERKEDEREARKIAARKFKDSIKVGDILQDSWGYDQTNVEFYKVIAKKGATVTIQELSHVHVEGSGGCGMSCKVMPDLNKFYGEPITKRIAGCSIKISSCISLTPWDGTACYKSWYA
jgi:hypothetical protein